MRQLKNKLVGMKNEATTVEKDEKIRVRAATISVLYKKVLLKILQSSQENNCARVSFLIMLQAWIYTVNAAKFTVTYKFCYIY